LRPDWKVEDYQTPKKCDFCEKVLKQYLIDYNIYEYLYKKRLTAFEFVKKENLWDIDHSQDECFCVQCYLEVFDDI